MQALWHSCVQENPCFVHSYIAYHHFRSKVNCLHSLLESKWRAAVLASCCFAYILLASVWSDVSGQPAQAFQGVQWGASEMECIPGGHKLKLQ